MDVTNNTRDELLREAKASGNQICRLRVGTSADAEEQFYIKTKRAYNQTEEIRQLYCAAFDLLNQDEQLSLIVQTDNLEIYEVCPDLPSSLSRDEALELLLDMARDGNRIFRIHSLEGEFIYANKRAFNTTDGERLAFLNALSDLLHHGILLPISDSKEFCQCEIANEYRTVNTKLLEVLPLDRQAA